MFHRELCHDRNNDADSKLAAGASADSRVPFSEVYHLNDTPGGKIQKRKPSNSTIYVLSVPIRAAGVSRQSPKRFLITTMSVNGTDNRLDDIT